MIVDFAALDFGEIINLEKFELVVNILYRQQRACVFNVIININSIQQVSRESAVS